MRSRCGLLFGLVMAASAPTAVTGQGDGVCTAAMAVIPVACPNMYGANIFPGEGTRAGQECNPAQLVNGDVFKLVLFVKNVAVDHSALSPVEGALIAGAKFQVWIGCDNSECRNGVTTGALEVVPGSYEDLSGRGSAYTVSTTSPSCSGSTCGTITLASQFAIGDGAASAAEVAAGISTFDGSVAVGVIKVKVVDRMLYRRVYMRADSGVADLIITDSKCLQVTGGGQGSTIVQFLVTTTSTTTTTTSTTTTTTTTTTSTTVTYTGTTTTVTTTTVTTTTKTTTTTTTTTTTSTSTTTTTTSSTGIRTCCAVFKGEVPDNHFCLPTPPPITYSCEEKCTVGTLQFVDNGCCRFNAVSLDGQGQSYAANKGAQTEEACLAYCNEDPLCIAADVRYPDPFLPYLEENVTYVCYNFYGDGKNFDVACKTTAFNERCYKKSCYEPPPTCYHEDLAFVDNGCCRFSEGFHAEPKGAQTEEACLAYCNEDPYCIAADVRYPDPYHPYLEENVTYVCYNFYSPANDVGFSVQCKTDNFNERCYKKPVKCTSNPPAGVYPLSQLPRATEMEAHTATAELAKDDVPAVTKVEASVNEDAVQASPSRSHAGFEYSLIGVAILMSVTTTIMTTGLVALCMKRSQNRCKGQGATGVKAHLKEHQAVKVAKKEHKDQEVQAEEE